MTENRFVKIDAAGGELPLDATEWEAVLDKTTGLMWSVADKKVPNWKKADAAAKKITAAGLNDWRMPTVDELFMLADRTRTSPAIDTAFFPQCESDWYWTSTPYASSPGDYAWFVSFNGGDADWRGLGGYGFVRAVRAGQL
jgi:hypothetical protein